jgi:hypothetical protein
VNRKIKSLFCAGVAVSVGLTVSGKGTVGENVTTFAFRGCPESSAWYNGYTRSFFTNRIDVGPTVFPKEYNAISDSWLNDSFLNATNCRRLIRNGLLNAKINAEGYVSAQQHPSSSLDDGWPFPVWPQVPNGTKGVTAGWHFYEEPADWEIVIQYVKNNPQLFPDALGVAATKGWKLDQMDDSGLVASNRTWKLRTTGALPLMTSPEGVELDSFNCPYVQIRWNFTGEFNPERTPYMEWLGENDTDWSAARRMYFYPEKTGQITDATGMYHSILPLYRHPEWKGQIKRIRFCLAPGGSDQTFFVNSVFTHWDTRHLVNNAIYIKAAWEYFRWTGDLDFLRKILPNLRMAMRCMTEEGHALEIGNIRCTWPGHDGRPGFDVAADGKKTFHNGHGKGGNYWDLLPFGWDDMYTTTHYYAALLDMARIEELVVRNPGWSMPQSFQALEPEFLRQHAAKVKATANQKFWNEKTGRFVGCIDADGIAHDYGFTFVNLEAIHYGIASDEHAGQILEWINGDRNVDGDTSVGADIYAYRLAPRATTKRNVDWYMFGWTGPETIPFGGQVQDGGAVLGFSFYDIMSRIKTLGADNAWKRLMEIRAWDEEVAAYGGYRKYYGDGKAGTTLQGGGTAGGIGIDFEFTESSMLSAAVPLGFMGLRPDGNVLKIEPHLPKACPEMTVRNLSYQGVPLDITVSADKVTVTVGTVPSAPLFIRFNKQELKINAPGTYAL